MFANLISFPIESEALPWEAKEVLRDLFGKPHLMLRVRISGTHFPRRALEPYIRVGETRSVFAEIGPDGRSVCGYFDRTVRGGPVEFGYGQAPPLLRCAVRFEPSAVRVLDRTRLPAGVQNLERFQVIE